MTIIRIKNLARLDPIYLSNYLHKKWYDGYFKMICRRHVNQASISVERLKNLRIPYPDIKIQREVANVFDCIDQKKYFIEKNLGSNKDFFKTMLHQLMTGQIRVKDFNINRE